MTLSTMSFILGAILVLAGILGGGFEAKEIKVPKVSGMARGSAIVVGLVFVALAFLMPTVSTVTPPSNGPATPPGNDSVQPPSVQMSVMEWNTDRAGLDYQNFDLSQAQPEACQKACKDDPQCKAWTYVKPNTTQGPKPRCWLKHARPSARDATCCVSGTKTQ